MPSRQSAMMWSQSSLNFGVRSRAATSLRRNQPVPAVSSGVAAVEGGVKTRLVSHSYR